MITPELLSFIRTQVAGGMSVEQITHLLVGEGGWDAVDVDEALRALGLLAVPHLEAAPLPTPPPPPILDQKPATAPASPYVEAGLTSGVTAQPEINQSSIVTEVFEPIVGSTSGGVKAVAPIETVVTPPTDDFLGIFSLNETPASSPEKLPTLETPPAPASPPPLPIITPQSTISPPLASVTPASPVPPAFSETVAVTEKPVPSLEEMLSSVTLSLPEEEKTTPPEITPPVVVLEEEAKKEETNKPQEAATRPVAFDLSMFRKSTLPKEGSPAQPSSAPAVKPVETKSVAEVWLQGGQKSAGEVRGIPPQQSYPLKTGEVHSSLLGKRTMASDILLRGKSTPVPGMPIVSVPAEEKKPILPTQVSEEKEDTKVSAVVALHTMSNDMQSSHVEQKHTRQTFKRVLGVLIGTLLIIAMLLGAVYLLLKLRGPDISLLFGNATQQFFALSSFGYRGSASTDLILSTATDGVERKGAIKFSFDYAGMLLNGGNGYGNGVHHVKLSGGLQSGSFAWMTDIESDVRLIGTALYFHVLSFPGASDVDPELFKTYWIKVDLNDISKELALEGVGATGAGYGGFGSGGADSTFASLMTKNGPFVPDTRLADETIEGVLATHLHLNVDPEKMITFAGLLYQKYTNKNLTLDANQSLRLKNALAKIEAEAWIDPETNTLLKFALKGDFDDDIVGVHVKGPLALSFVFSDTNKPVVVDTPTPMLTLEEVHLRMDDYKKVKEKRDRDAVKITDLKGIEQALLGYYTAKGRYPSVLLDLVTSGKLDAAKLHDKAAQTYFYYGAYVTPAALGKSGRCTTRGKTCAFYHLGINLEDMTNPSLSTDADQNTDVRGADVAGCGGETDLACYDVVTALPSSQDSPAASSTPTTK